MGDIHWARDLPEKIVFNIPPSFGVPRNLDRIVQMTRSTFERIGDYTRSRPTGPSPGRIYKKNLGWPTDMDDNWRVYFCVADDLSDPPGVWHVPYIPVFVDKPIPLPYGRSKRVRSRAS